MDNEQKRRINSVLNEAEEWYDGNNIEEYADDPEGDIMYDGFDMLLQMIRIKKGIE